MDFDSTPMLEEYARQVIAERLARAERDALARQTPRQDRRLLAAGRIALLLRRGLLRHPYAAVRVWLRLA